MSVLTSFTKQLVPYIGTHRHGGVKIHAQLDIHAKFTYELCYLHCVPLSLLGRV